MQKLDVRFSASASEVEVHDFLEVTLDVRDAEVDNPFIDVVVMGEFTREGGDAVVVEGFCDAQDRSLYRIRFMPTQPGEHQYSVTYRQGDDVVTHNGSFTSTCGGRRGIVRVDPEYPWHFIWEGTGEHYFWNSTTTYWLVGWDLKTIRQSLSRLHALKVNRVRAALMGRVAEKRPWYENVFPTDRFSYLLNPWVAECPDSPTDPGFDVTRFNVTHWRKYEALLHYARQHDIAVSVIFYVDGRRPGTDPFGKEKAGGEDEQCYYRYAVARLAAFSNVMWDVSNEYRLFRDDAWAEQMGAFIRRCDPYRHLMSVHGHGDFRFRTSAWADFAMYQRWDEHGGYEFMLRNREEQAAMGRAMPQVNEEYGYEDHYPIGWGESRTFPARSADNRRRLAWSIVMAGGYQTTGERANRGTGYGSDTGGGWVNGRGDSSMTMLEGYAHMADFFTSFDWWRLEPDSGLVDVIRIGVASPVAPKPCTVACRSPEGDLAVVYFQAGGQVRVDVQALEQDLAVGWFNPRDGSWVPVDSVQDAAYSTPDDEDWAMLFHRRR